MSRGKAVGIEFESPSAAGRAAKAGFAGLRTDVQKESNTQLGWVAGLVALLVVFSRVLDLVLCIVTSSRPTSSCVDTDEMSTWSRSSTSEWSRTRGGAQSLETVQIDDIEARSAQLTQIGMFAGTPAYASPEMTTGDGTLDARTDIYALGCVAFWMLTGRLGFPARDPMSVLAQHISALPDRPSAHASDVPPTHGRPAGRNSGGGRTAHGRRRLETSLAGP